MLIFIIINLTQLSNINIVRKLDILSSKTCFVKIG
nr:MAG TPA: hypothetical protein [Caudoviricetes sp.]